MKNFDATDVILVTLLGAITLLVVVGVLVACVWMVAWTVQALK